jgi:hypothetical protein
MAFVLRDRVRESSTTTGTGPITTAGAPGGYQPFSAVMNIADTCYYAIVAPGSAWETGIATYTGLNTLARTTVLESSNAGALVSFGVGSKDVFCTQPASKSQSFESGTILTFQQSAAPLHWTKQTTHNDKALRVVSGTAGSGGTNAFSTVNNQTVTVNNTTITQSTMASHAHTVSEYNNGGSAGITTGGVAQAITPQPVGTSSVGGDGAHSHGITIDFAVQFVDLILAAKD